MKTPNIEGNVVDLRIENITMVIPGGAGFYVLGHRIHEEFGGNLESFLAALPNVENFVKMTWVGDDMPFWANATQVKQVRPVDDNTKTHYKMAQTDVLFHGGGNRVVMEDPHDVCKMLNESGANRLDF